MRRSTEQACPKGSRTKFRQGRRSRRRQGAATQKKSTPIFRTGITRIAPKTSLRSRISRVRGTRPSATGADLATSPETTKIIRFQMLRSLPTLGIHQSRCQRTTSQPNLNLKVTTKRPAKPPQIQIKLKTMWSSPLMRESDPTTRGRRRTRRESRKSK